MQICYAIGGTLCIGRAVTPMPSIRTKPAAYANLRAACRSSNMFFDLLHGRLAPEFTEKSARDWGGPA